jgi:hypothetical protein
MNHLASLNAQVKGLLAKGQLPAALDLLQDTVQPECLPYNDLIQISGQFRAASNKWTQGLIKLEDFDLIASRTNRALLGYLQQLDASHLTAVSTRVEAYAPISDPLLLIGHSPDSVRRMDALFKLLRFEGYLIESLDQLHARLDFQPFRLLVFDNTDLPFCPSLHAWQQMPDEDAKARIQQRVALMEAALSPQHEHPIPLIHYGEVLYWINGQRDRVHPANSKYALYARVREALAFLSTTQGQHPHP